MGRKLYVILNRLFDNKTEPSSFLSKTRRLGSFLFGLNRTDISLAITLRTYHLFKTGIVFFNFTLCFFPEYTAS